MKIIYIDASVILLARYHYDINLILKKKYVNINSIFLSVKSGYEDQKLSIQKIKTITEDKNNKFIEMKTLNPIEIEKYLIKNNPDCVIFSGYRIVDIVWIAVCNKLAIKTVYFQHGFDVPHIKRSIRSLLNQFLKIVRYSVAIVSLGFYLKNNPILFLKDYITHIILGRNFIGTLFDDERLYACKCLLYSEYYINFWMNHIGLDKKRMSVIGVPDLSKIPEIRKKQIDNSCCYLAQTFVEDGRMNRSDFQRIIAHYVKLASSIKLIVKLHPRSQASLYSDLEEMENVKIVRNIFPLTSIYISHYSSSMVVARYLSNNVILHNLSNDPAPNLFREFATFVTDDINELIDYSKKHINDKLNDLGSIPTNIKYLAPIPVKDPLILIANTIESVSNEK